MRSPLTGGVAHCVDHLDVAKIVTAYDQQLGIDVARYFQGIAQVEVWQCEDSGYRYFMPFEVAGDARLYDELQKLTSYYRLRSEHAFAMEYFQPGACVLEVGAGPGLFLAKLRERGIKAVGLDHNLSAVERGRQRGLDLRGEGLSAHANSRPHSYDAVCAFQVLEHAADPRAFLLNCMRLLRPGGRLILGVPHNNPYLFKTDKYHPLNCPPHHMGLWSDVVMERIPQWFPLTPRHIKVERLEEASDIAGWFAARLRASGATTERLLRILGRRPLLRLWARFAEGRNVVAVYQYSERSHPNV